MPKPALLYISINDGSDTRINKEIGTLATRFEIYYLGIGKNTEKSFAQNYCKSFRLIQGHHSNVSSLIKFYLLFLRTFFSQSFKSIHVINEQLLLIFYPFLYLRKSNVVLDIFDSMFLRSGKKMDLLRTITYHLPAFILVTDDNRKSLMPIRFQKKTIVVENYPYKLNSPIAAAESRGKLVIFYNGSMSNARGTKMLLQMLKLSSEVEVKMAGWIYDEDTKMLSKHPQVHFLGVVPQQESMKIASQCDYILSLYEPKNENNINASPNKIYDAIQAQTPVIINAEVKIAEFVKKQAIGYVLDSFYQMEYEKILQDLISLKGSFRFSSSLQNKYTWEAIENKLLQAHLR
jgi:hypothetical protein